MDKKVAAEIIGNWLAEHAPEAYTKWAQAMRGSKSLWDLFEHIPALSIEQQVNASRAVQNIWMEGFATGLGLTVERTLGIIPMDIETYLQLLGMKKIENKESNPTEPTE